MLYSNGKTNDTPQDIYAENIFAKQLVLTDSQGKARMILSLTEEGMPSIVLSDANEQMRVHIGLENSGSPTINLLNQQEEIQATLTIDDDQFPYLRLYDQKSQLRSCLYIAEDTPALTIYDNNEKMRFALTLDANEGSKPYIILYDNEEQRQIALTVPTDNSEGFLLEDREGIERIL